MTSDPGTLIAKTLAAHRRRPGASLQCECGHLSRYTGVARKEMADHEQHVADAILAALDGRSYEDGVTAGRDQAAADIRAHADKHAPKDGNRAQATMRRHLFIAERVAAGPPTRAEVVEALNAMFAGEPQP